VVNGAGDVDVDPRIETVKFLVSYLVLVFDDFDVK